MAIAQIPVASSGLTSADIAPLARTSDLSSLATTAGLLTQPTWTLLGTNACTSAAQTQTVSGLNSFNYRRLRLVMRIGTASANVSGYQLRINGTSSTSYITLGSHSGFIGGAISNVSTHSFTTGYWLTLKDEIQYGTLNASGYAPMLGIIDISNANNTGDKHIESIFSYRNTGNYASTIHAKGMLVDLNAVISSVSIYGDNAYIDNSGTGFGIKVYGSN